jgi:hypothetical protein
MDAAQVIGQSELLGIELSMGSFAVIHPDVREANATLASHVSPIDHHGTSGHPARCVTQEK